MRQSVAVCIICYNEHTFIRACLKQFPDWISKILVLSSQMPWNGQKADTDYQMNQEIGKQMNKDDRIEFVKLNWRTEQEQRNWGLGRLYDFDWVLIVDADEFYTPEDWEKLDRELQSLPFTITCLAADSMKTYWKTWDYIWEPGDTHKPIIGIRPKWDVFFDKRCTVSAGYYLLKLTLHHLSWVKSDEEVRQKIKNWAHAGDFDSEKWYTNIWLKWMPEMRGLRPYGSEHPDTRAILSPLPKSIREYFTN